MMGQIRRKNGKEIIFPQRVESTFNGFNFDLIHQNFKSNKKST